MATRELIFWGTYVLLWALSIGVGLAVFRLQRTLHAIIRDQEGRAAEGLPVGDVAPKIAGMEVRNPQLKRNHSASDQGERPIVLWFMGATCQPCHRLRATASLIAEEYAQQVDTIVTCYGEASSVEYFAEGLSLPIRVIADTARENAKAFRIFLTPFVIVISPAGIIRRKLAVITADDLRLAIDGVLAKADWEATDPLVDDTRSRNMRATAH